MTIEDDAVCAAAGLAERRKTKIEPIGTWTSKRKQYELTVDSECYPERDHYETNTQHC